MLVSILINNYNYGQYLGVAIDSALNQTYSNIEIIVVDDGSMDDSRDVILSYGKRIIPVFKDNGGQASAFNAGFAVSQGEIVCFLDADDFFCSEKVEKIVKLFSDNSPIGFIFHELEYVDEKGQKMTGERSQKIETQIFDFREILIKGKRFKYSIPCGLCFRRSLISKILPMPEAETVSLSDNYIKYASLSLSPGMFLEERLACQRIHTSNIYTFRQDVQELRAIICIKTGYYLKQNFPDISLFAAKIFARGLAEMIIIKGLNFTLNIKEVKFYTQENFYLKNILFIFPRIVYHLIRSLLKLK